jgi:hypothetical protein
MKRTNFLFIFILFLILKIEAQYQLQPENAQFNCTFSGNINLDISNLPLP